MLSNVSAPLPNNWYIVVCLALLASYWGKRNLRPLFFLQTRCVYIVYERDILRDTSLTGMRPVKIYAAFATVYKYDYIAPTKDCCLPDHHWWAIHSIFFNCFKVLVVTFKLGRFSAALLHL